MEEVNPRIWNIGDKKVTVYPCTTPGRPVIYLNTFEQEGEQVYRFLREKGCTEFTLVTISGLVWNHDMSPWECPAIMKNGEPCTGGADVYIRLLTERVIPEAERLLTGDILWRGLAGYSLAGLFALYALYQTRLFERIASVSGSLWFPGFQEYIFSKEMKGAPEYMYFSLGDRECRTRNAYLQTVQERTEEIKVYYRQKGIDTFYELNPGNHFQNAAERTALGIAWLLKR